MSSRNPVIVWFRQDLRLGDNPAFTAAVSSGAPVLAAYILDDENAGDWRMGGASRWWLHQSLAALNASLDGALHVCRGKADERLPALVSATGATAVYWNRCYEPWRIKRDRQIREDLRADGISTRSFNGSLLWEPMQVSKADGSPYKVFTPFYRNGCLQGAAEPRRPLAKPSGIELYRVADSSPIDDLQLMPAATWYQAMAAAWQPGEAGAARRLAAFLDTGIDHYRSGRDRPDEGAVSRLSPHLHFGEVSPNTVWHAVQPFLQKAGKSDDADAFLGELGWREFSYSQLYYWPEMTSDNLQRKFNRFAWRDDPQALRAWQRGETGYPIVDAGMRELRATGYMHNRVRMIAGSFLVKNLLQHWHHGARWFWDTLVDADLANNSASWQWVAGSGADAAPYFRMFNPVTQARKFDPDGVYIRRHVPELSDLPVTYLAAPWEAPDAELRKAGVELGRNYPGPIVDLQTSRKRALAAFKALAPPQ